MPNSKRRIALIAGVLVALCAPARAQAPYFTRSDLQPAVDALDVVDLDGRRWRAADLQGRVVLIDFWATWCAPCLAQLPDLRNLRARFGPRGFEVLAISLNRSSRRDLVSWLNRQNIEWPQVHDGRAFNGPTAQQFGVEALPASVLVGRDGRVAALNLRGERLAGAVAALVAR